MRDTNYGDLGFYCVAILYGFYAPACLFASFVVSKLGANKTLLLGGCCYVSYCCSFILPARVYEGKSDFSVSTVWAFMLTSACINGFGSAVLWTAKGEYLGQCANKHNKGLYNGVFWGFYNGATIGGGLIASFIVSAVPLTSFYLIMSCFGGVAIILFATLTKPEQPEDEFRQVDNDEMTISQSVKETLKLLCSKRFLPLLPYIIYNSLSTSILAAFLVPLMTDTMQVTPVFDQLDA